MGPKGRERLPGRVSASPPAQRFCAGRRLLFSQQRVEKYFKARLLEAGLAFPRTHDLLQLLNACLPVEPLWSAFSKVVDGMTDYAVDYRYPGHSATLREARTAFKHCRFLRAEARRALGLRR